jgi:hypothetical protein
MQVCRAEEQQEDEDLKWGASKGLEVSSQQGVSEEDGCDPRVKHFQSDEVTE